MRAASNQVIYAQPYQYVILIDYYKYILITHAVYGYNSDSPTVANIHAHRTGELTIFYARISAIIRARIFMRLVSHELANIDKLNKYQYVT
jgi:hypothetical protein